MNESWIPVVKPVIDQMSDLFGARLVAGPVSVIRGIWADLQPHIPETVTANLAEFGGALKGEVGLLWSISDSGAANEWSINEEAQAGLWDAISSGVTAGFSTAFGADVTIEAEMDPQIGPAGMLESEGESANLVRLDISGDGITLFLGLLVSDEVVDRVKGITNKREQVDVVQARSPRLGPVRTAGSSGKARDLDVVLDLPLRLTVEVGKATVMLKDVLSMGKGSVIELDRVAGEPLDVFVNGKKVAKGEIVVLPDGNFGVRIVEVVSSRARLQNLQVN